MIRMEVGGDGRRSSCPTLPGNNNHGGKAPRGWGWLTNPKKALYNRIYHRTTFGIEDLFKTGRRRKSSAGCLIVLVVALTLVAAASWKVWRRKDGGGRMKDEAEEVVARRRRRRGRRKAAHPLLIAAGKAGMF
ncbi:MAG TPA: hypothetical protein VMV69_08435 [Pirellulales bacterium]|nr:hypothetical protein [Pirellulales bacterium]